MRKEFERSWRVYTRSAAARFERITDLATAMDAYAHLERMQAQRMHATGIPYVLDQPAYRSFYRRLLESGLADGSVVMTALRDGTDWVAVQLGVGNGQRFLALRLCSDVDRYAAVSPGRLCSERTGASLCEQGYHWIDFGIGAYFHKEVFNGTPVPLVDLCEPLSWRARPWVWIWKLRQAQARRRLC